MIVGTIQSIDSHHFGNVEGFSRGRPVCGGVISISRKDSSLVRGKATKKVIGTNRSVDKISSFSGSGFSIFQNFDSTSGGSFFAGKVIDSVELSLNLVDRTYTGGIYTDGTFVDSTYMNRSFNPEWISYSVKDSSNNLIGYRFREPLNSRVGYFCVNMEAPQTAGDYKIQWLYKKYSDKGVVSVNQSFVVESFL